ncbi:DUF421 domain-containing protein [Dyadobacter sandarakinus]|uniref:DUF421 domain-containing protein n=1 Tax=Dyadobacter sandarakinus TaxID=2747268 RepID=UPI001E40810F|nr:YetF domain-containing protein [Dyadobacter sandarakinus]
MKKEDIHLGDWQRMFLGDVPAAFYWEVVVRIAVIYLVLMISMRLMGKRMASQLSRNEMIALVSLAAAIGVPLQAPDRGILAAAVIAVVVVLVQQLTARFSSRNKKFESVTQGNMDILVSDSVLELSAMKDSGITRERAFAQLRSNGIRHLGEVKRLYFEAGGSFTMIKEIDVSPGLGVLPGGDRDFIEQVTTTVDKLVCNRCGMPQAAGSSTCVKCSAQDFTNAVI